MKPGLMEKIAALQQLADRAGTRAEAEVAAAKISTLLLRHNLTLADIAGYQQQTLAERDVSTPPGTDWEGVLAAAVAKAHLCQAIGAFTLGEPGLIRFIGREQNVTVAVQIYEWLRRRVDETCNREMQRTLDGGDWYIVLDPLEWRKAFRYGMVDGIIEAYRGARAESSSAELTMAMVLRDEVLDYIGQAYADLAPPTLAQEIDGRAYRAGYAAGVDTPTSTQIEVSDERALSEPGAAREDQSRPDAAGMATERNHGRNGWRPGPSGGRSPYLPDA